MSSGFALGEHGDYQFSTGSGSIRVRLPWDASFRLQAKTGSGPIVNEFASTQGDPDVGTQLKLKTGSGGIIVSRGAMVEIAEHILVFSCLALAGKHFA